MEKPQFLYHGSAHRDIAELEPRNNGFRDPDEGPVVFATQELSLATIFMAEGNVKSGKFNDVTFAAILDSKEEFIKNDKGGHVYIVRSDSFECDPAKGLGEYEWISREKIKPEKVIEYPSVLEAMMETGVQVYFIDTEVRERINKSEDHGRSILKGLESENQRREINVRPIK
jgi:hypothetical protein